MSNMYDTQYYKIYFKMLTAKIILMTVIQMSMYYFIIWPAINMPFIANTKKQPLNNFY